MSNLRRALRARYCAPGWALLEEVRDAAGHDSKRSADAMAMGLWKSHGTELHGFEIKASRGDWLRERNDPSKAETFARFCDRWWIVAADDVVRDVGELPPTWGLLVLRGKGLVTIRKADKLAPEPLPRALLANLLRRSMEQAASMVRPEEVEAKVAEKLDEAVNRARMRDSYERDELARRSAMLDKASAALGVDLTREWALPNVARALALMTSAERRADFRGELERAERYSFVAMNGAREAREKLEVIDAEIRRAEMKETGT